MRFIFGNSAIEHPQAATAGAKFFLTLDKLPAVEIDTASEILVGRNACTLLLENDANRDANTKVLASFDSIMQMGDDERRLDALRALLDSIRTSSYRSYFLFFDTQHEDETPVEFRMRVTCVRSGDVSPKPTTFDRIFPLAAFTKRDGGYARSTDAARIVSVGGTARKSIINGFAMLCVQTICIEGWTPAVNSDAARVA